MINLLANDGYRMFEAGLFCPLPIAVPLLMVVCAIYSCIILGPTALIGTFVYILFIPIQVTEEFPGRDGGFPEIAMLKLHWEMFNFIKP